MYKIWIDEPPVVEVSDGRATIIINIDGERMAYTMQASTFRTTVEYGQRRLDDAARRQQGNVVQFRRN